MYRKALNTLMMLLVVFGCIFLVSIANFILRNPILNIGLGYFWEDLITAFLSFLGIIRILFEIIKIEKS